MSDAEFTALVASTRGIVLAAIAKHLSPDFAHAIDDIAQETYLRAYRSLRRGTFRGEARIESWLHVIARNETLRMQERLIRERYKAERAAQEFLTGRALRSPRSLREVKGKLRELPDEQRQVMELFITGASILAMASSLGIPAGTVKSRMSRAKRNIRRLFLEEAQ
jgi:RNA polymerase sigma-70 factor, ECF subfamily